MPTPFYLDTQKIIVSSFSGGRTSARMTKMIIDAFSDTHKIIVLFINTGQEDERTLKFVDRCDTEFGFDTIWLESVVHPIKGVATTHKVVDYFTACRDGSLFEDMIKKYGIPNRSNPHCTRELKLQPILSYLKSQGVRVKDRYMAVGIRADESRRVSKKAIRENIIYPLIDMWPTDKEDVIAWWGDQSFNLDLPEHLGNCVWCWKKSLNKHMHVIHDAPDAFELPARMEEKYAYVGAHEDKSMPRVFFRGHTSTQGLLLKYKELNGKLPRIVKDTGACGESCEIFDLEETIRAFDSLL